MSIFSFKKIEQFLRRTEQDNYDFLKSIPLISNWPNENIFRLIYNLQELSLKRKQVLFDIGDPVEMIYFIRSGEIEVRKFIRKENNILKGYKRDECKEE